MDELGVVRRINDVRRRTRDGEATLIHRQILDQLHLLPREDPDMSTGLATMLAAQGDDTRLDAPVAGIGRSAPTATLAVICQGGSEVQASHR